MAVDRICWSASGAIRHRRHAANSMHRSYAGLSFGNRLQSVAMSADNMMTERVSRLDKLQILVGLLDATIDHERVISAISMPF